MISYLEGTVELKGQKFVIVNVGGIGYKVFVSPETLEKIPEKSRSVNTADKPGIDGEQLIQDGVEEGRTINTPDKLSINGERSRTIKIWTHQYIREDAEELYGFLHFAELDLFETLIGVSGVGPKTALGVMGVAPIDTLKRAIASGDTSYLTKVSGIGRKTAERIIVELREKMAGRGVSVEAPELKEEVDALEALQALGYSQKEARDALSKNSDNTASAEKRIKEALKNLGRKK